MKSIIVGTAGHIDHGKTTLVKALTGIDADRLEEEKRRGITIDLGFAHMELPRIDGQPLRLGFVDVPGHERFVRNMLAGVGGIDLVLFVIAADESIKPQTREHFDILQLLGVKRGITVLTKSDAVDAETLDVVRLEVEEFLRGTFLDSRESPLIAVSALNGAGLEDLKRAIALAATSIETRDSLALARLPIDRVFTMKGFGTVVTGTLIAGTIGCEDELEVSPSGQRVRVRGIQVHGDSADKAVAGQRTALNLAGATTEDLSRGMTLARPETFSLTRHADVQLKLLRAAPHPVKDRSRVHFHCHTMETVVEIALHGAKLLRPGEETFARLKLPHSALLLPGDRFIIRQFSPVVTIGGGVMLDAAPVPRKSGLKDFLPLLASGQRDRILIARIARRANEGIFTARLTQETGWTKEVIGSQLAATEREKRVIRDGNLWMDAQCVSELKLAILAAVGEFHKSDSLAEGISKEALHEKVGASESVFAVVLDLMIREKNIETTGELVRLAGHRAVMKDEEAESRRHIEGVFASAGLKVPALHEVLAGLKIEKARAAKIVTLLLREKVLIKLSDELVFHRSVLEQLRRQIAQRKTIASKIDVAGFKDLTGVSRKYAIPLLEYLDRERVTRRVGDIREIL
jgi:selenocysteine-specific elongation factor